jgi:tellurite resistance protein
MTDVEQPRCRCDLSVSARTATSHPGPPRSHHLTIAQRARAGSRVGSGLLLPACSLAKTSGVRTDGLGQRSIEFGCTPDRNPGPDRASPGRGERDTRRPWTHTFAGSEKLMSSTGTRSVNAVPGTAGQDRALEWVLPISIFSIPLGLAGLGGAWMAAAELLGMSTGPADASYAAATILWVAFTDIYVVSTIRHHSGSFRVDLRHPLTGPLTAYIPVIAILLVAYYARDLGGTASWLCYLAVAALTVNAAALVAHWLSAPLEQDSVHPGYFLPVVAGPFIASIGLVSVGGREVAVAAFGIGIYFWLLLGSVITARLFFGPPLPPPFQPVLSILLSPPGTACLAWFVIADGRIDRVQAALGGVTLFLLLTQLFFLRGFLRLRFSTQHWVFVFPLAVLGNIAIRWAAGLRFDHWRLAADAALALSTAAILAILAGTLRDVSRWIRHRATRHEAA